MNTQAFILSGLLALIGFPARAQSARPPGPAAVASVSGRVIDSLARKPLAGAIVQIAPVEGAAQVSRTASADTLGRFTLDSIPAGRYMLGFFHPMLDSLGIEPPVRELTVTGDRALSADLAIPSAISFRNSICGTSITAAADPNSGALVVGIVRNANDLSAVTNASVAAEWLEYSFSADGVKRRVPKMVAKTAANGWYALCNVPSKGALTISAARGTDSTARIDLEVAEGNFHRRDLYLGGAGSGRGLSTARISGTIRTADGAKPVADAEVSISGNLQTRTNENGDWSFPNAAAGTRMLEIRAVGYYPVRRAVDVVAGAPQLHLQLATLKSVLATVRVTAQRSVIGNMKDFEFRRKTSNGKFITAADLERRQPIVVSDVFRFISGITLWTDRESGATRVQFRRGAMADQTDCYPDTYVDGKMLGVLTVDQLDAAVHVKEIRGIEIYVSPHVPQQFSTGTLGNQCGSILIWTKFG